MTCVWEPDEDTLDDAWATLTPEQQERCLYLATSSLQMLTYYRVGTCPITIRPCPAVRPCACAWNPHVGTDGLWRNNCPDRSVCAPLSEIDLPGPVGYIDRLLIDGAPVDVHDGNWRLDNGHLLVWQGAGLSPVPAYQDLNKPDTEISTWSVTYSRSYPVLLDGRIAVALLAMEFAKALKPRGKCGLPRGVTSVVRNGVSFSIEAGLYPNGLTGLDEVDQYILKWAPAGSPTRPPTVFNPSRHAPRNRVTAAVPYRGAAQQPPTTGPIYYGG